MRTFQNHTNPHTWSEAADLMRHFREAIGEARFGNYRRGVAAGRDAPGADIPAGGDSSQPTLATSSTEEVTSYRLTDPYAHLLAPRPKNWRQPWLCSDQEFEELDQMLGEFIDTVEAVKFRRCVKPPDGIFARDGAWYADSSWMPPDEFTWNLKVGIEGVEHARKAAKADFPRGEQRDDFTNTAMKFFFISE